MDGFVRTPMPACVKCHQHLPLPDSQSDRLMPVWSGPNKDLLAFKRCPRRSRAAWLTHCFSLCEFWVMSWSTFGHSMKVKLRQGGRHVKGKPVLSVMEKTTSIRPGRFKWCSQEKQKQLFSLVYTKCAALFHLATDEREKKVVFLPVAMNPSKCPYVRGWAVPKKEEVVVSGCY